MFGVSNLDREAGACFFLFLFSLVVFPLHLLSLLQYLSLDVFKARVGLLLFLFFVCLLAHDKRRGFGRGVSGKY